MTTKSEKSIMLPASLLVLALLLSPLLYDASEKVIALFGAGG